MATPQGNPNPSPYRSDPLAGIDVIRIRVEGAICDALEACDKVSRRADELDTERGHAVGQAVHGARLSLIEALRRCGRLAPGDVDDLVEQGPGVWAADSDEWESGDPQDRA